MSSNFQAIRDALADAKLLLVEGKEKTLAAGVKLRRLMEEMPADDFWIEVIGAKISVKDAKAAMYRAGWRDPNPVRSPKRIPNYRDWLDEELDANHKAMIAELQRRT